MSEPRRLLDDPASTELERSLLRSWDHEQPSNVARERTLVALGIGAGAAVTAAAGSASAAAAAGGSIAPKAATGILLLKWWAISTVAVGAVAGGTAYVVHERHVAPPPIIQAPPAITVNAPPPVVAPPPVETTAPAPTVPMESPQHVTVRPKPSSSSLTEEVAQLDRARAALDAHDPTRALALADEYEARYPHGAFIQEAEVLRVQALLAKGDRDGAERAGNKFLAAYPKSPHAARVRALLAPP